MWAIFTYCEWPWCNIELARIFKVLSGILPILLTTLWFVVYCLWLIGGILVVILGENEVLCIGMCYWPIKKLPYSKGLLEIIFMKSWPLNVKIWPLFITVLDKSSPLFHIINSSIMVNRDEMGKKSKQSKDIGILTRKLKNN